MRRPLGWVLVAIAALTAAATAIAVINRSDAPTGGSADQAQRGTVSSLPPRNVVGYWQGWGKPSLRLRDVPRQYNIVMAAFAVGDTSGRVRFTQYVQSQESFVADVDDLSRAGQRVVLSIGGWNDGGLEITTDAQLKAFMTSVTEIIDAHHFQGIDWDLEHGIDPARLADATFQLKAKYGPRFLITMAPRLDGVIEQQQLELGTRIKNVLDMANIQFYNRAGLTSEYIVDRALTWGKAVGMNKVGLGVMTVQTPTDTGVRTPAAACSLWGDLLEKAPEARGIMTWSINLDQTTGYRFARTCAPVVLAE